MEEERERRIKSKYNSSLAIILRLDNLWKEANSHARREVFKKWNLDLDNIWRELARDLDDKDYDKFKAEFDDFDTKLAKTGDFIDQTPSGWKELSKEQIDMRSKQYKILSEKDLFLRRLENHIGKGTEWEEGDDDDFE